MIKGLLISLLVYSASTGIAKSTTAEHTYNDVMCLAKNIYFEARGSNLADQIAVANVVLNRVNDNRYPNTVCDVVKQGIRDKAGNMVRHKCQFSWYCDGKSDTMRNTKEKEKAIELAKDVILGRHTDVTEGATHYHATYVNPDWARSLQKVRHIGVHIFYRWE
jgi:spore germination cell wall hydrolase CwlJ-like protein